MSLPSLRIGGGLQKAFLIRKPTPYRFNQENRLKRELRADRPAPPLISGRERASEAWYLSRKIPEKSLPKIGQAEKRMKNDQNRGPESGSAQKASLP